MSSPLQRHREPPRIIRIYRSQHDYETDRARWLGAGWRVAEARQFAMAAEISQSGVHRPNEPTFVRVAYEPRPA